MLFFFFSYFIMSYAQLTRNVKLLFVQLFGWTYSCAHSYRRLFMQISISAFPRARWQFLLIYFFQCGGLKFPAVFLQKIEIIAYYRLLNILCAVCADNRSPHEWEKMNQKWPAYQLRTMVIGQFLASHVAPNAHQFLAKLWLFFKNLFILVTRLSAIRSHFPYEFYAREPFQN